MLLKIKKKARIFIYRGTKKGTNGTFIPYKIPLSLGQR